jgi:hypothetical protein
MNVVMIAAFTLSTDVTYYLPSSLRARLQFASSAAKKQRLPVGWVPRPLQLSQVRRFRD